MARVGDDREELLEGNRPTSEASTRCRTPLTGRSVVRWSWRLDLRALNVDVGGRRASDDSGGGRRRNVTDGGYDPGHSGPGHASVTNRSRARIGEPSSAPSRDAASLQARGRAETARKVLGTSEVAVSALVGASAGMGRPRARPRAHRGVNAHGAGLPHRRDECPIGRSPAACRH